MNEIEKEIIALSKEAIEARLYSKKIRSKYELVKKFPEFVLKRATFITIKIDGKLRGCIGSLIAHRELYDDIVNNAFSAAFKDPRFKPLSIEEYENITLEVSLLSEPVLVDYENKDDLVSKIEIGKDGVILKKDQNQATFLPQVWDELKDFDTFFSHLCHKAGLDGFCLDSNPQIYKYQVQKIK